MFALLMVAACSTSLIGAGKPTPPPTPSALTGTYAVQWILTDGTGSPKMIQGTLTFGTIASGPMAGSPGILAGTDNLFLLEPDGTSTMCSNTDMVYSGTGIGTLAGNAATFVVAPNINCNPVYRPGIGTVDYSHLPWLVMTFANGGREFWLAGSPASAATIGFSLSGHGILQ